MVAHGALPAPRRAIIYALNGDSRTLAESTLDALRALRSVATQFIVTVPAGVTGAEPMLRALDARVVHVTTARFHPSNYRDGLHAVAHAHSEVDEIVLTGEGWFGPLATFSMMIERMDAVPGDGWQAAEIVGELDESFDPQGHPLMAMPWAWFVARRSLFESADWADFWRHQPDRTGGIEQERSIAPILAAAGHRIEFAFPAADYPTANSPAHAADLLIEDGYPFLDRGVFGWYPPYLDRHGIDGRDFLDAAERRGLGRDSVLSTLARTIQPRTLNANAGLLEVIPQHSVTSGSDASGLRVAAVVYARDLPVFEKLCGQLAHLPAGFDLVITTTDGRKAAQIERFVESRDIGNARLDVRVTPSKKGRDIADFLIGCRDLLLEREYDVLVKVHARKHPNKTLNALRYFNRYQTENLLASDEYVQNVLALFASRPRLGVVFPPMMHIGYSIIGTGWGGTRYRTPATRLLARLGVSVPVELVSPLAPYGGMWICRPEALAPLAEVPWTYRDYGATAQVKDLARVQERIISHVAGEAGYYAQTVLNPEHAAISHTAIDFKSDQMFSTTSGYPVEAIQLIQRAGRMSGRGAFGLSRMYLNLNHPVLAAIWSPFYNTAYFVLGSIKYGKRTLRQMKRLRRDRRGGF